MAGSSCTPNLATSSRVRPLFFSAAHGPSGSRYASAVKAGNNNVRTEFALLRRYHRLYAGLTLSIDESREENSIMFSIWPQGVKDLTFGDRRYASFRDGILEN